MTCHVADYYNGQKQVSRIFPVDGQIIRDSPNYLPVFEMESVITTRYDSRTQLNITAHVHTSNKFYDNYSKKIKLVGLQLIPNNVFEC